MVSPGACTVTEEPAHDVQKLGQVQGLRRRDLSASTLPRFLLEIRDEELEQTGKLIGWEDALQLMYRRGGW